MSKPSSSDIEVPSGQPVSSTLPQDTGKFVLHHATGLHGPIRSNMEFVNIDDDEVNGSDENQLVEFLAAPVGQHMSFMRLDENTITKTRFLPKKNVSLRECLAMAVDSKKKVMALTERVTATTSPSEKTKKKENSLMQKKVVFTIL